MLKKINPVRFIALAAFIILLLGVFCSLYFTDPNVYKSVVPYPTITIPVINIFSAFFALLLFIFPSHKIFMYFVLIPQIISTTLTTHETLGAFLYVLLIVIIYFNDTLSIKAKKIIIISSLRLVVYAFRLLCLWHSSFCNGLCRNFVFFMCDNITKIILRRKISDHNAIVELQSLFVKKH